MAGKTRAFTIEDPVAHRAPGAISLSPDGRRRCTLTSYSMDENTASSALWLLSTFGGGPRRLTSCGDKDGQPAWSPTGEASPSSRGANSRAARTRRRSST